MTTLTREHAIEQARRLQVSPMLAPQTVEGKREIVDCLMRHCQSVEHAADVMTEFLDSAVKVEGTSTAAIAAIARSTRPAESVPPGCNRCEIGEDAYTGAMRWHSHVTARRGDYDCAVRCSCERGRWLTAKDAERIGVQPTVARPNRMSRSFAEDWQRRAAGDS